MKKALYFAFLLVFVCYPVADLVVEAEEITELEEFIRNVNGKVEELIKQVADQQNKINGLAAEIKEIKRDGLSTKKEINSLAKKSEMEIINAATSYIEDKKMEEARQLLESFIKDHPDSVYVGMMKFYVGRSYSNEGKYHDAALAYMNSYRVNPNGKKAPDALHELGLCFKEMSKKEQDKHASKTLEEKGKQTFKKLIESYPNRADLVSKAQKELKELK